MNLLSERKRTLELYYFTWSLISFCWRNLSIMIHLSPLEKDLLILLTNILYKTPAFLLGYLQIKNLRTFIKTEPYHTAHCTFIPLLWGFIAMCYNKNKTNIYLSNTTTNLTVRKSAICFNLWFSHHQAAYRNWKGLILQLQLIWFNHNKILALANVTSFRSQPEY
jgi:hypothetical protein